MSRMRVAPERLAFGRLVGLVLAPVGGTETEVRHVSAATAGGPFRGEA